MAELWAVLVPLLITDVLNPVLFAFLVYAAGSRQPVANSAALLAGHTLAYFGAGLVLALGFDSIADRLENPRNIDYVIGLVVGCLLLLVALRSRNQAPRRPVEAGARLTPAKALGIGAIVNFVGIPFALPYFAAVDQILKADLDATGALAVLAGYNLLYALPFVIVPVAIAVYGEKSGPLLQRVNDALEKISGYLMPVLLAAVRMALLIDDLRRDLGVEQLVVALMRDQGRQ